MIVHDGILYDTLIKIPDFFETDKYETYEKIFKRLIKHYNALSKGEEIIIQSLILELLYDLGKDSAQNIAKQKNTNRHLLTEKAIGYIKEHLTEDLSLDSLCEKFYISKAQLNRNFKRTTGTTVWSYIQTKRLLLAKEMLGNGYNPVKVAANCGFNDYCSFFRAYKTKFSVSPKNDKMA